jgi:hypothetical protein
MTSDDSLGLNGFVEQLRDRKGNVEADLEDLLVRKVELLAEIRAKRVELAGVDRLWRATQPRRARRS